jgi:1-deoxy-D-xylulose-5-phosphate reductoisomerase
MKSVAILGSTGSIGTQALEVIKRYPDSLCPVALAAATSIEILAAQVREHRPEFVSVLGEVEAGKLADLLSDLPSLPEIAYGPEGLIKAALYPGVTTVLNGLVGAAGFKPTLESLRSAREVLLANKESLVMAGEIIRDLLKEGRGSLIPVDSEHSAIYQCLGGRADHPGLSRIILTASGGPFLDRDPDDFDSITVEEALSHPTWKMGPKITVDSATLMNKGLEIIEAHYLFGLPPEKIDVVIHPPSIVHSLVEFKDRSMLAQLSHPTMEIPIQYALLGGERRESRVQPLDLAETGKLEFFPLDSKRFPAPDLARHALTLGGTAPAVLNGANEEAVGLFLDGKIRFTAITELVRSALEAHDVMEATQEGIISADKWAREHVRNAHPEAIT